MDKNKIILPTSYIQKDLGEIYCDAAGCAQNDEDRLDELLSWTYAGAAWYTLYRKAVWIDA